jgi:hypothetical protein
MDGTLTSSNKELGERLLEMESFVLNNPSFSKVEQIKEQYRIYIDVYLKGANNTRIVTEDGEILNDVKVNFETFFKRAKLNPNAHLITGVICGYRIEEIETPLTKQARYLDKLVDELAKGRKMEKILRQP